MNPDWLNVIAAACSALAAFFAWWIALVSLRDSRALAEEARRREAQSLESHLQARLDPLYPGLRAVLGTVDDGVPLEIRSVLIPFFVLYADAFAAHRDGILSDSEWKGLGSEFTNWAQRPTARRAWKAFRRQQWTDGFVDHVDEVLSGPAAYRGMVGVPLKPPTILWAEDPTEPAVARATAEPAQASRGVPSPGETKVSQTPASAAPASAAPASAAPAPKTRLEAEPAAHREASRGDD